MWRPFLAVLVGFVVASLIAFNGSLFLGLTGLWGVLVAFSVIPPLAGGLLAGYLARHRGWVYGLIVGCLYVTLRIIVMNYVWSLILPTFEFITYTISMLRYAFTITLSFTCFTLISSTAGGLIGQLLAQIWHKRAQRKADASQSENR